MAQVSLRDYCDEASSLIQSGEFGKAILITRHILHHYPRHVESYRLLGQALLKAGNSPEAAQQFWRVLSADPEDLTSRVGLAKIYETAGDLDDATWQMQWAFELAPSNADLRQQLRRLKEARQTSAGDEFELTRAALGRIYARGQLHAKAIQEFKAVLAQEPDRFDVQVSLAEVLWRAGQNLEAVEVCQRILKKLPNALKPNLILGTARPDEAKSCLGLAQALDPENVVAQSLFGEKLPLAPLTIKIERLSEVEMEEAWGKPPPTSPVEDVPLRREEEPATDWITELYEEEAAPMSEKERADEEFELPNWLQGVGDDLLGEEDVQAAPATPAQPPAPSESSAEETPAWLRDLLSHAEELPEAKEPVAADETLSAEPGEVPDWLRELRPEAPEEAPPEAGVPDWLAAVAAGESLEAPQPEAPTPAASQASTDQLDWLNQWDQLEEQPAPPAAVSEPVAEADEGRALWDQILAEEGIDLSLAEEMRPPGAEGMTAEEWLRSTFEQPTAASRKPTEVPPRAEPVAEIPKEEAELPDWLKAEGPPVEEEEVVVPPVGEIEPSVLEPIKGVVEEAEVPDWLREIAAGEPAAEPETAAPAYAGAEVEEAGLPDWLREFKEPAETIEVAKLIPAEAEPEAAPEAVAEELPDWLSMIEEPAAAEAEVKPTEEGLPDWLRQIAAGEPVRAEEAPKPEVPPAEVMAQWPKEPAEVEAEAAELPAWLREVQEPQPEAEALPGPAEEYPRAEVQAELEEEELPDWLRKAAEGEVGLAAEVPDWLKMLESEEVPLTEPAYDKPIELETGEMPEWLGEVMAEELPLAEEWAEAEIPEERAPDWLRDLRAGEKEEVAELPAEELALEYPPPEKVGEVESELPDWLSELREGVLEEVPPAAEYAPTPAEEAEMVEAEAPAGPEAVAPEWVEEFVLAEERPAALEAVPEEVAPAPEEAIAVAEAELPQVKPEPVKAPPPVGPVVTRHLEPLRAAGLPQDVSARLEMARAALNTGDWPEALSIYETLVTSSERLKEVISSLEEGVEGHPDDPAGHQLLGDAYVKAGRLQDALQAYRTALTKL